MIVPVEISEEKKKSVMYKRNKSQVSLSSQETRKLTLCEKVVVAMNKKDKFHYVKNSSRNVKNLREPLVKHHAEPNVEVFSPTSGEAQAETTKIH